MNPTPAPSQSFQVQGMSCSHCVAAVTRAVQALDPEARVDVDLSSGSVRIASGRPREALAQAIVDEGYAVAR
ncbi:cation transporter [Aquabacterium sp. A7-Y]|uniref:heavy-metal-associated domain-containing protein n=1 Tax=Aquabacterium sp. A7-Y TaxID=1349605 RepID=UPI00223E1155|nr:cation transporter [Aquabacterium sp. A7-Y]MCW7539013.1 cation transporter [Aquabacterium sp. A7-Y]